jgi:thiamine biosynthesis protein ThiC
VANPATKVQDELFAEVDAITISVAVGTDTECDRSCGKTRKPTGTNTVERAPICLGGSPIKGLSNWESYTYVWKKDTSAEFSFDVPTIKYEVAAGHAIMVLNADNRFKKIGCGALA